MSLGQLLSEMKAFTCRLFASKCGVAAMSAMLSHFDRRRSGTENDGLYTFDLPNGVNETIEKSITIRLADCDGERSTANMLINRKYSGRGYGANHKVPTAPNCVTFTASSKDSLIGTLSLTVDSAEGLAGDKTFKEELDAYRAVPGAKLCELTKFAFDTSKPSMHLLASLFHIIFIYGTHHHNCTDLFIEVNPRHRRFYQAMLGFKPVGAPKTNDAVGAPSYLMVLKVSEIRRLIDEHKSNPSASVHSLYGYFFSVKEELGIYDRLVRTQAEAKPIARANRIGTKAEKMRDIALSSARKVLATRPTCGLEPAIA